jgi:transcriptional regulator with XRE-family HTH domain
MPRVSRLKLPPLDLEKSLGERLAQIRNERGFTQTELAEKVGILQNIVSAYEKGRLRITAEMLLRFAKALDVSADEILGIQTKPSNGSVKNRRLLRRLSHIDNLPKRDQEALLRTIDAFLTKAS